MEARAKPKAGDAPQPVFHAKAPQDGADPLTAEEVQRRLREAGERYASRSARIEYCRSHDVDLEMAERYLGVVVSLDGLLRLARVPPEHVLRLRVGPRRMSRKGGEEACALCSNKEHETCMCPLLPDDLRLLV